MTTVRELVFTDPAGEAQAAQRLPHDVSISRAVLGKVSEALDFELGEIVLWAWRTRSALLDAARETAESPELVREVSLRTYAVPWEYELQLGVMINGTETATIAFALVIEVEVTDLAATVAGGRLTAVRGGRLTATAALEAEGLVLARSERLFELPLEIDATAGIPLLPASTGSAKTSYGPRPATDA